MKTIIRTAGAASGAMALALMLTGCPSGQGSSASQSPTAPGITATPACQPPGAHPSFIAILAQGINSSVYNGPGPKVSPATASFDAAKASYCSSPDGKTPPDNPVLVLRSLADGWLGYKIGDFGKYEGTSDDGKATPPGPQHDLTSLIDALAHAGGYVLPYSYKGATMSGTPSRPMFSFTGYDGGDVANNDPRYDEPPILDAEVASIHRIFPSVPIVVIGHSNGGLIAEQWWVRYRPTDVAHIFSLDGPINGVGRAGPFCQLGVCGLGGVGGTTASAYVSLWQGSASDRKDGNAALLALDGKDHLYTASGTYGDPLYDVGDAVLGSPPHNGILSQLILDPHCLASEDTTSSSCAPITPFDVVSQCGPSLQSPADGSFNNVTYGVLGSLWIHSKAKNCAGTVNMIMSYISSLTSSPPPTSASPSLASSLPPASASPSPTSPTVSPGYGSPQDAVDGFYQGELAGDWSATCSYVDPAAQALCLAGTSGQGAATGHVTVGNAVISGSEALVPVTGRICAPSTPCVTNSDPTLGMPPSPSQFAAYYAKAVANGTSSSTTVISPMPCSQIGGKWYVAFG